MLLVEIIIHDGWNVDFYAVDYFYDDIKQTAMINMYNKQTRMAYGWIIKHSAK